MTNTPEPKRPKLPKITGIEALDRVAGKSYPSPTQLQQAAKLAAPGEMHRAALARLLDLSTTRFGNTLIKVVQMQTLTPEQEKAVEQAYLSAPDPNKAKPVALLWLLLCSGSDAAGELATRLSAQAVRSLGRRYLQFEGFQLPNARKRYENFQLIQMILAARLEQPEAPVARPLPPPGEYRYYSITARLLDTAHDVWRRFLLADDATWYDLHAAIQKASGSWDCSHLWALHVGKGRQLLVDCSDEGRATAWTSSQVADFIEKRQLKFSYVYDFGDNWRVSVTVAPKAVFNPVDFERILVDGAGPFPPEDCGGTWRFDELVDGPDEDDEEDEYEQWVLNDFDLEVDRKGFDLARKKRKARKLGK